MPIGKVESLDHEARGIVREDGKAVFVDGALPGELVEYASFRRKPKYELAHLVRVLVEICQAIEKPGPKVCPPAGLPLESENWWDSNGWFTVGYLTAGNG